VNGALAAINGLAVDAHIGKTPREILGSFAEEVEPHFAQVMATGNTVTFEAKGCLATREKPGHWVETYIPIRSEQNRVTKLCALVLEVTEKKKFEETLFGLAGRLAYLKETLRTTLLEIGKGPGCEGQPEARMWRSLGILERCTADIADMLNAVRPAVVFPRANNGGGRAQLSKDRTLLSPGFNGGVEMGPLSPRERQVLRLLASDKGNKEIALALSISVRTVESHRRRIMEKLGIHSLAELVRYAVRARLVEA
jgi:DNA-binding CsgD family transcriptional regulator